MKTLKIKIPKELLTEDSITIELEIEPTESQEELEIIEENICIKDDDKSILDHVVDSIVDTAKYVGSIGSKKPHRKHRWTNEMENALINTLKANEWEFESVVKNNYGLTEKAIYNKLFRMGYRINNGKVWKVS
jgi:hypothetical protein